MRGAPQDVPRHPLTPTATHASSAAVEAGAIDAVVAAMHAQPQAANVLQLTAACFLTNICCIFA